MATEYCTADQVAAFLQLQTSGSFSSFATTTVPTKAQVEEMINENEDHIDEQTMHSWRASGAAVIDESHHIDTYSSYEYRDGVDIFLNHRDIREFDSNQDDKIEVWNGSIWEDYLSNRTEGRNNDYWIDYRKGIIFLRTIPRLWKTLAIRVSYRYGKTSVSKDIRKACIRLTALDVIQSDDRTVLLPEGSGNLSYDKKVEKWEKDAEKIISSNKEIIIIG